MRLDDDVTLARVVGESGVEYRREPTRATALIEDVGH